MNALTKDISKCLGEDFIPSLVPATIVILYSDSIPHDLMLQVENNGAVLSLRKSTFPKAHIKQYYAQSKEVWDSDIIDLN